MTVAELRAILAGLPDDHLVVLASDAEGHVFSVAVHAQPCEYHLTNKWGGSIRVESDRGPDAPAYNAICIWPTL